MSRLSGGSRPASVSDTHTTPPNQISDYPQYNRRIGAIPKALTPILRHLGIKYRHIHQTLSRIHKTILHENYRAWNQDQKELIKWQLPNQATKPRKLTYPKQIHPSRKSNRRTQAPNITPTPTQPKIIDFMGKYKHNKIADYYHFYKSQPTQTNRDIYTKADEIISYKRKRYDQGALQWTYNNSHVLATKQDYSRYTENHLNALYFSITNKHLHPTTTRPPKRRTKRKSKRRRK